MSVSDAEVGAHLSLNTPFSSRTYTDEDLLDLREPMRLLDERDRMERRAWRAKRGAVTMAGDGTPGMGPAGP